MISIPDIKQEDLLDACINGIRDNDEEKKERKTRLINSKQSLLEYSNHYKEVAEVGQLSTEERNTEIQGGALKDDMIFLYDERLVKSVNGKKYYDKIKAAAPHGKCPICGYYEADTLDHYLPKAVFHRYAVTIENLVPECIVCNKKKTTEVANNRMEETIHPYFDNFDDEIWMYAIINRQAGSPFGFDFEVRKPDTWDDEKFIRAKNHLKVYKLYDLYRVLSAAEINTVLLRIKKLYRRVNDIGFLRETIKDDCDIEREQRKNSWQAAMYQCIYEDTWIWEDFMPTFLDED